MNFKCNSIVLRARNARAIRHTRSHTLKRTQTHTNIFLIFVFFSLYIHRFYIHYTIHKHTNIIHRTRPTHNRNNTGYIYIALYTKTRIYTHPQDRRLRLTHSASQEPIRSLSGTRLMPRREAFFPSLSRMLPSRKAI